MVYQIYNSLVPPSCADGDIRMRNETYTYSRTSYVTITSRVEVCQNGSYVAVCSGGLSQLEAEKACNYRGYSPPYYSKYSDYCNNQYRKLVAVDGIGNWSRSKWGLQQFFSIKFVLHHKVEGVGMVANPTNHFRCAFEQPRNECIRYMEVFSLYYGYTMDLKLLI